MRTPVRQNAVIPKIIAYLELQGPLSEERINAIKGGLCYGFSVVHAYMAAEVALPWWYAVLHAIAEWDITTDPNDQMIKIAGYRTAYNLNELLERACHYLIFNFADQSKVDIGGDINQSSFLKSGGLFCSEKGPILRHVVAAGYFSSDALAQLLIKDVFKQKAIFLISSATHACSLRFSRKKWHFYDPNDSQEYVVSPKNIVNYLIEKLGNSISIHVAAWDYSLDQAIVRFEHAYDDLLNNALANLIHGLGLHLILKIFPEQISKIFTRAMKEDDVRAELAQTLLIQNRNGNTVIQMITKYVPAQFSELFTLAQSCREVRSALAQTLVIRSKGGFSGLLSIVVNAPDQLDGLFVLAENYCDVRSALVEGMGDDTSGVMVAQVTMEESPIHFGKLLTLAKNHGHVRERILQICIDSCRELTSTPRDSEIIKKIITLKNTIGRPVWNMLCAGDAGGLKKLWMSERKSEAVSGVTFFSENVPRRRYLKVVGVSSEARSISHAR